MNNTNNSQEQSPQEENIDPLRNDFAGDSSKIEKRENVRSSTSSKLQSLARGLVVPGSPLSSSVAYQENETADKNKEAAPFKTKEEYYAWEEKMWNELNKRPANGKLLEQRNRGLEICGILSTKKEIEGQTSARVILNDTSIEGRELCTAKELQMMLPYILHAAKQYPPDFIKKLELRDLFFLKPTGELKKNVGGTANGSNDIIFYPRMKGFANPATVFHHELFHVIDRNSGNFSQKQTEWWLPIEQRKDDELGPWAYARDYGMKNDAEDKATIADSLWDPAENRRLRNEAGMHKIKALSQKIRSVETMYAKASDDLIDEQFWKDLQEDPDKITPQYWEKKMEASPTLKWKRLDSKIQEEIKKTDAIGKIKVLAAAIRQKPPENMQNKYYLWIAEEFRSNPKDQEFILNFFAEDKDMGAKAIVRIGWLYEQFGNDKQALKIYMFGSEKFPQDTSLQFRKDTVEKRFK